VLTRVRPAGDTTRSTHLRLVTSPDRFLVSLPNPPGRASRPDVEFTWDTNGLQITQLAGPLTGLGALQILLADHAAATAGAAEVRDAELRLIADALQRLADESSDRPLPSIEQLRGRTAGGSLADVVLVATIALGCRWVYDLVVQEDVPLYPRELLHLRVEAGDADTAKELTQALFGRSGRQLTRHVVQALASGREHAGSWLVALSLITSGLSDDVVNDLVGKLAEPEAVAALSHVTTGSANTAAWLDLELRELSPQRQRRLISELMADSSLLGLFLDRIDQLEAAVADTEQPMPRGVLNGCRNIREACRRLSEVTGDVERQTEAATGDLPRPAGLDRFDGASFGTDAFGQVTIRVARDSRQLSEWGNRLRNCLGTMISTARQGRSVFFALEDRSGKVRAAGELSGDGGVWCLEELLGYGNSSVEDDVWRGVTAALEGS